MSGGQEGIMEYQPQQVYSFGQSQQDPLGIVVYNDLPDGACFNRTLATRDSARSCPPSSTSTTSMMLNAKTLQSKPKSMATASKPSSSRLHRPTTLRPRPLPSETFIYETVDKPAQYLGSFPVRSVDQSTRSNMVRKQLSSMKDVPSKRSVLINISLDGIKVCCPKGQNIYSHHDLRRISYATCDPAANLLAFLAREPHAPLHLQHCHVFRTSTPSQAEDLNTLIGNAFRIAYASQIQDEHCTPKENSYPAFRTSRSADSLLSPDVLNGTPEDFGIDLDEPVYEIPDFNRSSKLRHSEQTFNRKTLNNSKLISNNISRVAPPALSLPVSQHQNNDFFTIEKAPHSHCIPQDTGYSRRGTTTQPFQQTKSKFKPNSLPVLNCLFAALGKHKAENNMDETPYVVPDLFTQMNNNVFRNSNKLVGNSNHAALNNSFTQDDLRLHDSGISSQHSGESYYVNQRVHEPNHRPSSSMINKSKSAHVISCEVYSEVLDHTDPLSSSSCQMSSNTQALCNTSLKTSTNRRPGHWNVDSLRQQFDMNNADLIVSPGCNSSRNGSSGFSSGEASTNSSATTPPPLMSSNMYNQHESTSSILDEAELKNAPWFQKGIPRDLSLEVLRREPEGSFVVRASNSKNGLALSVRVPDNYHPEGIINYLIIRSPKGFKIKGCQKQFPTVTSLLVHHSVMPEMLPCPLLLNRYNNPAFKINEDSDENSHQDEDNVEEDDNYLDPERDYELINSLRQCIMKKDEDEISVVIEDFPFQHQQSHQH